MTQTILLGDLIEIKHGYAFKGEYFSDAPTNNALVTPGNFAIGGGFKQGKLKYYNGPINDVYALNPNSVIVTMTDLSKAADTLGFSARVPDDRGITYLHNQRIGLVTLKSDAASLDYIYWLMRSSNYREWVVSGATGSTVKHTAPSKILSYKFELPDLPTQKKIAAILGTIDEKIELNRRMNETLEQMGQALFRHYFITNPEAEKWEEKSLDEIANFLNGLAMQKYPRVDGEPMLPVIKIREMSSGITANTDIASANISEQYIVHNGDLLFSWSGTLLVKFWVEGDGALNQHLFKVSSKEYPEWLYYYWTKHYLDDFILTAKSKATTMGHIQRKHLKQAIVRVPDVAMIEKIGDQIQPLVEAGKENAKQIQTLTTLRDTLLPRLIDGKVKI